LILAEGNAWGRRLEPNASSSERTKEKVNARGERKTTGKWNLSFETLSKTGDEYNRNLGPCWGGVRERLGKIAHGGVEGLPRRTEVSGPLGNDCKHC